MWDFLEELPIIIRQINEQGSARVIVLSSTGKHFCAGMDLAVFTSGGSIPTKGDPARLGENLRRLVLQLQDCFNVLEEARMPVISAVQGGCIGGALDMVCATDMRYCTEDAYFTIKRNPPRYDGRPGHLTAATHTDPPRHRSRVGLHRSQIYRAGSETTRFGNEVFATHEAMMSAVLEVANLIAEQSRWRSLAARRC